jgi:hypothetical protein
MLAHLRHAARHRFTEDGKLHETFRTGVKMYMGLPVSHGEERKLNGSDVRVLYGFDM